MLRTIGIPAREAVGYVPGSYNPITDLYEVEGKDAHAWVQVWFAHYGWQSFDPTAVVPLANPSPGGTLIHDADQALHHVPVVPLGIVLGLSALAASLIRWRRRRPPTWAIAVARRMERAGARAGRVRRPGETIAEYAAALDLMGGDASGTWTAVAFVIEASAYGDRQPSDDERRRSEHLSRISHVGGTGRHRRRPTGDLVATAVRPAGGPGPRPGEPGPPPAGGSP
jgi:hypothetical protein